MERGVEGAVEVRVEPEERLDPALVRRLTRPLTQPGLASMATVRRIVGWVKYFEGGLPLLEELTKVWGGKKRRASDEELPVVYAEPAAPIHVSIGQVASAVEGDGGRDTLLVVRSVEGAADRGGMMEVVLPEAEAVSAGRSVGATEVLVADTGGGPAQIKAGDVEGDLQSTLPAVISASASVPVPASVSVPVSVPASVPVSVPASVPVSVSASASVPIVTPHVDRAASLSEALPVQLGHIVNVSPGGDPFHARVVGPDAREAGEARGDRSRVKGVSPGAPGVGTTAAPVTYELIVNRRTIDLALWSGDSPAAAPDPIPGLTPPIQEAMQPLLPRVTAESVRDDGAPIPQATALSPVTARLPDDPRPPAASASQTGLPTHTTSLAPSAPLPAGITDPRTRAASRTASAPTAPPGPAAQRPNAPSPQIRPSDVRAAIDMNDLVSEVQRRLMRRVAAERERRGGSR